jgi:FKBP-type peptidyl-prolyl cis-trans isomerase FklB
VRSTIVVCCVLLLGATLAAAQEPTPAAPVSKARASYAVGADIARNMRRQEVPLELEEFVRGFRAAFAGTPLDMTDQEIRDAVMSLQKEAMARQQARTKELGDKAKVEGEEFLAANKSKEGVVNLPSGLQYKVIKEGTGRSPSDTDRVKVNYRGTLVDGTEFDSSYSRNQPAEMAVTGVIKGWTEALKLMKEGAKWQLFIPASLAYGERGAGQKIPPNSALVFEIELLEVKAPAPKPAAPATEPPPNPKPNAG